MVYVNLLFPYTLPTCTYSPVFLLLLYILYPPAPSILFHVSLTLLPTDLMDVMETLEGIGIALTASETALFTFVPFTASLYALTLYEYSVPVLSPLSVYEDTGIYIIFFNLY